MNFNEIVALSETTRHQVYHYLAPNGETYSAPSPKKEAAGVADELKRMRDAERRERAKQIAAIVERAGVESCESHDVSVAELIDPPVHIQQCAGDVPLSLCLILEERTE